MPKPTSPPSYRLHKQSGQGIVTLRDAATGRRRDILLGKHGTPESRKEYARVLGEWEAANGTLPPSGAPGVPADLTVNELLAHFLLFAEARYSREGVATSELREYKIVMGLLKELHGHTLARNFGPRALKAVRQSMVDERLSRGVINQRVGRIRRIFKFGVAEELLPPHTRQALEAVEGLRAGQQGVEETEPVRPVPDGIVERTLPFLNRQVAALVRLQRLTGMRPGEACIMRPCDIDTSGTVWLYAPQHHKTQHRGKARVVAIGPRAQEVIRPFLDRPADAYLFSPREAREDRYAAMRSRRKSKVPPSQECRRKAAPERLPALRYTPRSYHEAIQMACTKANAEAEKKADGGPWEPVPEWHPHQLRHTHATEVRRVFGLEAAQVALGHSSANVTEIYAERDMRLAADVAANLG
jgi:integrase